MEHDLDGKVRLIGIDYGKETVKRPEKSRRIREKLGTLKGLKYSISHTDRYSIAAVSKESDVGADIEIKERLRKRKKAMDLLFPRDCDIKEEIRWCLHEAIGKMEGKGLQTYFPIVSIKEGDNRTFIATYQKGDEICEARVRIHNGERYLLVWGYKNKQERRKT